jgi:hypothetical protein
MKPLMGPVLSFRGATDDVWSLSALAVWNGTGAPPSLRWSVAGGAAQQVAGSVLRTHGRRRAIAYGFDVPRGETRQQVEYDFGSDRWHAHVPARGAHPRMAFASCNGFSDPKKAPDFEDQNERWKHMRTVHDVVPIDLLLLGGDQIYADSIWTKVPSIEKWNRLTRPKRIEASFTVEMRRQVEAFYFALYCERWAQPEVAWMWASVPTLMTWDDHDIFDGWGSYDPRLHNCDVYQQIFKIARDHFCTFQLQAGVTEEFPGVLADQQGYSFGHRIGDLALLFLDTRSERSLSTILGLRSWDAVFAWLGGLAKEKKPPRHLLIVTPVPVLYPKLEGVEWAAGLDPRHEHERLEDDLRDHWTNGGHAGERKRLLQQVLAFAEAARCRVTFLSGDVHVAALGILESDRHADGKSNANVINQLVSSPVVHLPPGRLVRWALEQIAEDEDEIERGLRVRMVEVPGRRVRIVNRRNWLELDVDEQPRIWANWHFEGETEPSTKVVHPIT